MATERVNIVFQTRGVRRVRRDVGGIGDDARRSATAVGFLKASLGGLGVGIAAREFVRFSDTATRITNQIRLVSTDTANLNRVMAELFQVARDTRSGIEPTAELYSRLQRSARTLGLSQEELLDLTTGVSQAFKIFGNNAAEAEAALVQFSQGLAAGALRGDELRSVLEQAPRLAQAIADGLNEIGENSLAEAFGQGFKLDDGSFDFDIVIGSLRELGAEGELTAERVIRALQTQLDVLEEEFGTTLPTIEDAFEQLRNKVIQLFQSSEFQAVSGAVASVLLFIADNFDILTQVVGTAAVVLGTVFAVKAIGAAIAGLQALFLLIAANPISALILAIVAAIGYIVLFGDRIAGVTGGTATLRDEFVAAFRTIRDIVGPVITFIGDLFSKLFGGILPLTGIMGDDWRETVSNMYENVKTFVTNAVGTWVGLKDAVAYVWNNLPAIIKDVAVQAVNFLIDKFEQGVNKIIEILNSIKQTGADVINGIIGFFQRGLDSIIQQVNSFAPGLRSTIEETLGVSLTIPPVTIPTVELTNSDFIQPRTFDRLTNDAEGAGAGIGAAFTNGFRRGADIATGGAMILEETFDSNLAEVEAERRAREAREALGALTTLSNGAGTPVGTIGDDGGSGGSSAARKKEMEELERHNELLAQNAALRDQEREAMTAAELIRKTSGDLAERNVNIQADSIAQLRELIGLEEDSAAVTQAKHDVVSELQGPLVDYITQMTALNQLLQEGTISQGEFNEQVANLALVQELQDLDSQLENTRFFFEAQAQELRDHQQSMLNTVQEAMEARLITEQEAADRILAINADMNAKIREAEMARYSVALQSASSTFGSLAEMTKAFAGEQSGIYKVMFAASKAFAIADSIIKIQQGIANALSLPFPANLAAVATVAAEAASIVSNIQAVALSFRDGGYVMGPGTGTSDSVPANLSNGEFVVRESQTRKYRDLLEAINAGRPIDLTAAQSPVPFAFGGFVSPETPVTPALRSQSGAVDGIVSNRRAISRQRSEDDESTRQTGDTHVWQITTQDADSFRRSKGQVQAQMARAVQRGRRNN